MTKKSAARLQRDNSNKEISKALKTNTAWDDLKKTSQAILETLNFEAHMLGLFFSQEPLMALVPQNQHERVNAALATVRTDNETLVQIHQDIAAKHADRSGRATTEAEALLSHELYMAYLDLTARFEQLDKTIFDYLNGVREDVTYQVALLEADLAKKAQAAAEAEGNASTDQTNQEATKAD